MHVPVRITALKVLLNVYWSARVDQIICIRSTINISTAYDPYNRFLSMISIEHVWHLKKKAIDVNTSFSLTLMEIEKRANGVNGFDA